MDFELEMVCERINLNGSFSIKECVRRSLWDLPMTWVAPFPWRKYALEDYVLLCVWDSLCLQADDHIFGMVIMNDWSGNTFKLEPVVC